MLLKEIKALKTVKGQDRFGNPIAGKDLYDERRVYIVDNDMKTIESFMNMEAATRAMKNNPKKFANGKVKIMSGKELNKMFHAELEEEEVVRDHTGKPLRGIKKELALRARKQHLDDLKSGKDRAAFDDVKDDMVGAAKIIKVKEEALETIDVEELWSSGDATTYVSNAAYLVRPIKGTVPTEYEVFSVVGDKRKMFGKFNAVELKRTLKPIRPNQTPDAEGFITYTDPAKVEAFKYNGEPAKVQIDDSVVQISKGDYVVRTVKGNNFEYHIEDGGDFESTLKKA